MRYVSTALQLLVPVGLLIAVGLVGGRATLSVQTNFATALIYAAIVIALYVFVGNSGVISFGHISFVAVGAFGAGIATVPRESKQFVMPGLFPFLERLQLSSTTSLLLAAALGGAFALVAGLPLMRLAGLAAGIATFAVLGITHNLFLFWTRIGPGAKTLSLVPSYTGLREITIGAVVVAVAAFAYQHTRSGRLLRASREDPAAAQASGMHIYRHRLLAFTISGALAGFAGGLLVHELGSLTVGQVYLELTFLTLAMLVIGGASSLLGATVGALFVSGLDSWLARAENGTHVVGTSLNLPHGSRLVILSSLMALVLLARPAGITGGREFRLPRLRRAKTASLTPSDQ
jgi:branched-chain amino acid transport system permease protein